MFTFFTLFTLLTLFKLFTLFSLITLFTLFTLFNLVNYQVAHGKSSRPDGLKQIPEICSRLTKTLVFNSKPDLS